MVSRDFSATIPSFFAGLGAAVPRGGSGTSGPRRPRVWTEDASAVGNAFSSPSVPNAVTSVAPSEVFTLLEVYFPRLNPASGMGRSETQWEVSIPLVDSRDCSLPVANSFHSMGALNSRSNNDIAAPRFGYQAPRSPT